MACGTTSGNSEGRTSRQNPTCLTNVSMRGQNPCMRLSACLVRAGSGIGVTLVLLGGCRVDSGNVFITREGAFYHGDPVSVESLLDGSIRLPKRTTLVIDDKVTAATFSRFSGLAWGGEMEEVNLAIASDPSRRVGYCPVLMDDYTRYPWQASVLRPDSKTAEKWEVVDCMVLESAVVIGTHNANDMEVPRLLAYYGPPGNIAVKKYWRSRVAGVADVGSRQSM